MIGLQKVFRVFGFLGRSDGPLSRRILRSGVFVVVSTGVIIRHRDAFKRMAERRKKMVEAKVNIDERKKKLSLIYDRVADERRKCAPIAGQAI